MLSTRVPPAAERMWPEPTKPSTKPGTPCIVLLVRGLEPVARHRDGHLVPIQIVGQGKLNMAIHLGVRPGIGPDPLNAGNNGNQNLSEVRAVTYGTPVAATADRDGYYDAANNGVAKQMRLEGLRITVIWHSTGGGGKGKFRIVNSHVRLKLRIPLSIGLVDGCGL